MYALRCLLASILLLISMAGYAQTEDQPSDIEQITATLMDYIEGTANGEPDRLRRAFHPDFQLYTVTDADSLLIRSGQAYIAGVKEGETANRIGRIISIDFEKDAAIAKAEIIIPNWRIFTDYFLLMRFEGSWKIVHKSYTWRPYAAPEREE
ncbi:MAG: nuclear transport factor 2 family protein [Lewinella sp.]|nr:nuclear transport factor 2 family protein [Lewinella sp.]